METLRKLCNGKGFSLFESIVALLIISLLTIGVATGVNTAASVYKKSLFLSESDVLAATVDTALSDVLRFSSNITEQADGTVQFTNANYSVRNGHFLLKDGWLYLNLTNEKMDDAEDAPLAALLNGGIYTSMKIDSYILDYKDGVFSGSYVIQSKEDSALEKSYEFYFRPIN
ncbi:MAG: prepilin-type N-terminal cleavage/methylation domain-containing protein [Anaerotignum sp.]|nr:prepilin-type N-terminal cleavage/methylation domain-containing protein [Anaerotignum sp.]